MTNKVHGGVQGGEFLTGKMDFFGVETTMLMDQTNVETAPADLYQISSTVWTPVTVLDGHGVAQTYATKADYIEAWKKQKNLDKLIQIFATRANPVMVSVNIDGNTFVNLATERTGLWFVDDGNGNYGNAAEDTNYTGFLLGSALTAADVKFWAVGDDVEAGDLPSLVVDLAGGGQNVWLTRKTYL